MQYDTIEFTEPYEDINTVLYWLIEQAKAGVPYCEEKFPKFNDPAQMFQYFNKRVTYRNDPPKVELIQSPGTLFEANEHGISGAGDCDCFVTLLLSCAWANGWYDNYIVLYGRSKKWPSHISFMTRFNGRDYYMDLTEKRFNSERDYPLKQILPAFKKK